VDPSENLFVVDAAPAFIVADCREKGQDMGPAALLTGSLNAWRTRYGSGSCDRLWTEHLQWRLRWSGGCEWNHLYAGQTLEWTKQTEVFH